MSTGTIRGRRKFDGLVTGRSIANKSTDGLVMDVDYANGTSPPAGTVVSNQTDYDELVAGFASPYLKYPQDALDILPPVLTEAVKVNLGAGQHEPKPDNYVPTYGFAVGLFIGDRQHSVTHEFSTTYPDANYSRTILFQGVMSVAEAEQAGSAASKEIVRSAGSWITDEHKGKLVEIKTGAGAGSRHVIRSNTIDTLTVITTLTGGACTFEIIEPGTNLAPGYGDYALFMRAYSGSNIRFENIDFGSVAVPAAQTVTGMRFRTEFVGCRFFLGSSGKCMQAADARCEYDTCYFESESIGSGALVYNSYVRMLYCYGRFRTTGAPGAGGFWSVHENSTLELYRCVVEGYAGYAYPLFSILNGKLSTDSSEIDGLGVSSGIVMESEDALSIDGVLTINNCGVAVSALPGSSCSTTYYGAIGSIQGSGNTTAFKLDRASITLVQDPTLLTAINEIDIDGAVEDYTSVPNAGDWIEGSSGSRFIR